MPNPFVDFANVSSMVSLQADLVEGDDPVACIGKLQQDADAAVERHLEWITGGLHKRHAPVPSKAEQATAAKGAGLVAKHGGKS